MRLASPLALPARSGPCEACSISAALSAIAMVNAFPWVLAISALPLQSEDLFPLKQVISTPLLSPEEAVAADVDGDQDLDLIVVNGLSTTWLANLDGHGAFGSGQTVGAHPASAQSVFAADLDGDGDPDVLAGTDSSTLSDVAWFENTGVGTFGPRQVITTAVNHVIATVAADLDGDGDLDVLSASEEDSKVAWYENTDGAGAFGPQVVITTAHQPSSLSAADLDGDGDFDALTTWWGFQAVAWYENSDGQGTFGAEHLIPTSATNTQDAVAADLDGDGDLDIPAAFGEGSTSNSVAWFENTGAGVFGPQISVATVIPVPGKIHADDLDGDGDVDLLSAMFGFLDVPWRLEW